MTEYAYKLVSLKLGGRPDWPALERARAKGWEPVPLNEMPDPAPNPLDMTPQQLESFTLCRMPRDKHEEWTGKRYMLNAALAANTTHEIIALYKATCNWPPVGHLLQRGTIGEDTNGEPIWGPDVFLTEGMLDGAKLAYDWLNARGLA